MDKGHYYGPREYQPVVLSPDDVEAAFDNLDQIGVDIDADIIAPAIQAYGMDAIVSPLTTAAGGVPVQFLQAFLPGMVEVVTTPTRIDDLTGVTNVGNWEDEEVVQATLELTGNPAPYGDYTNVPLASWQLAYEKRSIIRFEEGLQVGKLEEARSAKADVNSAETKRRASSRALNIQRNRIGFSGYNNGVNRTYGFLNDPGLSAYVTVANGAGGDTPWSTKTYLEITADIRVAMAALRLQSGDNVDPNRDNVTLALATQAIDFLSVTSDFGNSVMDWLKSTYPNLRITSAPELNEADGGENVFYLYAETVPDSGSDDGQVFCQLVPTMFKMLGSEQGVKTYVEDYTNATAGIMLKRPYAVVRYSGV